MRVVVNTKWSAESGFIDERALLRGCLTCDLLRIWVVVRVRLVSTLLVWGGDTLSRHSSFEGETPCLDTPLLRGRYPVLTLMSRHSSFEGGDTLSRHSSFEGETPCLDTAVSALLFWGGDTLSRHSSFEGETPCLGTPRLRGSHNVHPRELRVSLPYVHGRTLWSSVFHLLVLSPSAAGQLQKQCPCRWPSVTCECTAWIWSLFLVLETGRRNTTYLPDSDLKTLVFIH